MAIDRMKKVTFLAPRDALEQLLNWLQRQSLVHLEDAFQRVNAEEGFRRMSGATEQAEARLRELELIEQVFNEFAPRERGFMQSLVSVPMLVKRAEMMRAVSGLDAGPLCKECAGIAEQYRAHQAAIEAAEGELQTLRFFEQLPFEPVELGRLKRVRAWVGSTGVRNWQALREDLDARRMLALQELVSDKRAVHLCALALEQDAEQAARLLRTHGFAELPVPRLEGKVSERISELVAQTDQRRKSCDALRARVVELSGQRRQVEILLGYWKAEERRLRALTGAAARKRIAVLCGYVRTSDAERLESGLAGQFPQVSIVSEDPTPDDKVPVSLTNHPIFRPVQFLVDMFGRPDYFSFDPTPYLSISFMVFFGMCFSDVIYGLLLCAVSLYLWRKAQGYPGLRRFTMMFAYCGASTMIFGALSGSWAADLPDYLGEGNAWSRVADALAVVKPLDKAVALLMVCLGIGVANQLYGICLKGYGLIRRGKVAAAVFDAGLWLLALPGFLIVVSPLFLPTPGGLFRVGLAVFGAGAAGLVLTQGRHEKGFFARAVTGLVSLYGILGTYGCVSFIGDMLSYSRLLALGLTTSIVGMSFNIIAELVRGVPYAGVALFALVVVFGHLFNFAVSILGSFVHPARLIFLEFFNRFYEGGGVRFAPLSLDTDRVQVEA